MSSLGSNSHGERSTEPVPDKGGLELSEVVPGFLYLSGWAESKKLSLLRRYSITHILSVGKNLPPSYTNEFSYQIINAIEDKDDAPIIKHFDECISFISLAKKNVNGRVLVHCEGGVSRSATICAAYLMKSEHLSVSEALSRLQSVRSVVAPNVGFCRQLQFFYESGCTADDESVDLYFKKMGNKIPSRLQVHALPHMFEERSKKYEYEVETSSKVDNFVGTILEESRDRKKASTSQNSSHMDRRLFHHRTMSDHSVEFLKFNADDDEQGMANSGVDFGPMWQRSKTSQTREADDGILVDALSFDSAKEGKAIATKLFQTLESGGMDSFDLVSESLSDQSACSPNDGISNNNFRNGDIIDTYSLNMGVDENHGSDLMASTFLSARKIRSRDAPRRFRSSTMLGIEVNFENASCVPMTPTGDNFAQSESVLENDTGLTRSHNFFKRNSLSKVQQRETAPEPSKSTTLGGKFEDNSAQHLSKDIEEAERASIAVGKVLLGYTMTPADESVVTQWLAREPKALSGGDAFRGLRQALRMMRRFNNKCDDNNSSAGVSGLQHSLMHVSLILERFTGFPLHSPQFVKMLRVEKGLGSILESLEDEFKTALKDLRTSESSQSDTTEVSQNHKTDFSRNNSIQPSVDISERIDCDAPRRREHFSLNTSEQIQNRPCSIDENGTRNSHETSKHESTIEKSNICDSLERTSRCVDGSFDGRRNATIDVLLLLSKLGFRRGLAASRQVYRSLYLFLQGGKKEITMLEKLDHRAAVELLGYLESLPISIRQEPRVSRLGSICKARLILMVAIDTVDEICDGLLEQFHVTGHVRDVATYCLNFSGALLGTQMSIMQKAKSEKQKDQLSMEIRAWRRNMLETSEKESNFAVQSRRGLKSVLPKRNTVFGRESVVQYKSSARMTADYLGIDHSSNSEAPSSFVKGASLLSSDKISISNRNWRLGSLASFERRTSGELKAPMDLSIWYPNCDPSTLPVLRHLESKGCFFSSSLAFDDEGGIKPSVSEIPVNDKYIKPRQSLSMTFRNEDCESNHQKPELTEGKVFSAESKSKAEASRSGSADMEHMIDPIDGLRGILRHLSRVTVSEARQNMSYSTSQKLRTLQDYAKKLSWIHPRVCVADSENRPGLCRLPRATQELAKFIGMNPLGVNQTPYCFDYRLRILSFFPPCNCDTTTQPPDDASSEFRRVLSTVFELMPVEAEALHDVAETPTLSQHASAGYAIAVALRYIDQLEKTDYLAEHRLGDETCGVGGSVTGGYLHHDTVGEKYVFTEESGHYGVRWTHPGTRQALDLFMQKCDHGGGMVASNYVLKPFYRDPVTSSLEHIATLFGGQDNDDALDLSESNSDSCVEGIFEKSSSVHEAAEDSDWDFDD